MKLSFPRQLNEKEDKVILWSNVYWVSRTEQDYLFSWKYSIKNGMMVCGYRLFKNSDYLYIMIMFEPDFSNSVTLIWIGLLILLKKLKMTENRATFFKVLTIEL